MPDRDGNNEWTYRVEATDALEEGATHSLSVAGKDINGLDLGVVAENMMK